MGKGKPTVTFDLMSNESLTIEAIICLIKGITNNRSEQVKAKKLIRETVDFINGMGGYGYLKVSDLDDGEVTILLNPEIGKEFEVCKFELYKGDLSKITKGEITAIVIEELFKIYSDLVKEGVKDQTAK